MFEHMAEELQCRRGLFTYVYILRIIKFYRASDEY